MTRKTVRIVPREIEDAQDPLERETIKHYRKIAQYQVKINQMKSELIGDPLSDPYVIDDTAINMILVAIEMLKLRGASSERLSGIMNNIIDTHIV